MKFKAIPITLTDANAFVKKHHRHSIPTRGHKFSVGCELEGVLVGVAMTAASTLQVCAGATHW